MNTDTQKAEIDLDKCSGCGMCAPLCAYDAIMLVEYHDRIRAKIDETICNGCGLCVATCPSRAITLPGSTQADIDAVLDAIPAGWSDAYFNTK